MYTFGDLCLSLSDLVRLDFEVVLSPNTYIDVRSSIFQRYREACWSAGQEPNESLMTQAHSIERQKKFGPFGKGV